jgi:hypothetical protein
LSLFFVQLAMNAAWSWMFFAVNNPLLGLINIFPQLLIIIATVVAFYRLDRIAGSCLIPLAAWVALDDALSAGDIFGLAKRLLMLADRIYLLGFGFGTHNISRLGLSGLPANRAIATATGFTQHEVAALQADIEQELGGPYRPFQWPIRFDLRRSSLRTGSADRKSERTADRVAIGGDHAPAQEGRLSGGRDFDPAVYAFFALLHYGE